MKDLLAMISGLERPKLLVRAARFGVDDYDRGRHLDRILKSETLPRTGPAILRLLEREAALEDRRTSAAADYSVAQHIEVLIALMGEARILRAAHLPTAP